MKPEYMRHRRLKGEVSCSTCAPSTFGSTNLLNVVFSPPRQNHHGRRVRTSEGVLGLWSEVYANYPVYLQLHSLCEYIAFSK